MKHPNLALILLFILMSVYCSLVYFRYTAIDNRQLARLVYLPPVDGIILLSMTICIYYYVNSLLGRFVFISSFAAMLHFIAYIPFIIFNIGFFLQPANQRIDWTITDFEHGSIEMKLLNLIIYTQLIVYLIICQRNVIARLKVSDKICFDEVCYNIRWLKSYLMVSLIVVGISFPACFYFDNERTSILIGLTIMNIQFIFMFFKWTIHNEIEIEENIISKPDTLNRIEFIIPDNDEIEKHIEIIGYCMEEHRPYLDDTCNIKTVAELTGLPVHQLSNILNLRLKKNFPDFINEYRINHAKRILISRITEEITIEQVALECGFGSKSTFNRAFKKFSDNITPSEFIRQNRAVRK